jgi:hypothetical protein
MKKFLNISLLIKVDSTLTAKAMNSNTKDSFNSAKLLNLEV